MNIHHWIVVTVSILTSLGVFVPTAWAETQEINFTDSFQSNQTSKTSQINFTLRSESNQTFAALMQQAEVLAVSFLEQGFADNPSITEISVRILGERNGQEAPLLFSRVSRSDWQRQPSIQQWTKYFGNSSAVLLGFLKPQVQQSASPVFEDTAVQRSTPITSEDTSTQQPTAPNAGNSTQQTTAPNSAGTSIQQTTAPNSAGTSTQNEVELEEGDTGIR